MLLRHNVSLLRQARVLTEYDPKRGISVSTLAYEYPSSYQVPEHAHGSDQLIYAISGHMEVSSGQSMWLIPPHFALWIPARTHHRIHMSGPVSMRTLYLRTGLASELEPCCAVLHVTPLLRELVVEIVRVGQLRMRDRYEGALRDLLIFQLQNASPMPHLCDAATRTESTRGGRLNIAESGCIEIDVSSLCRGRCQCQDY
jgi:mannose-6-phosphate isomerase-like protein (cupin superfamily)